MWVTNDTFPHQRDVLRHYLLVIRGLIPIIRGINMCINTSLTQSFKKKKPKTKHFHSVWDVAGSGRVIGFSCLPLPDTPLLAGDWNREAPAQSADPQSDTQAHTFTQKRPHGSGRRYKDRCPKIPANSKVILPRLQPTPHPDPCLEHPESSLPVGPPVRESGVPALSRSFFRLTLHVTNKNWAWPFKTPVWISHLPNDFMSPRKKVNFLLTFPPLLQ